MFGTYIDLPIALYVTIAWTYQPDIILGIKFDWSHSLFTVLYAYKETFL